MDYVVGSVAAIVSGNVTPNRPRLYKKALTPTKHQSSPNVTPKSELVDDRSVFLSPTMQKKKAIVKKSPKRIFSNPDWEATSDREAPEDTVTPKADKVKKHLKDDLKASSELIPNAVKNKSPKKHGKRPIIPNNDVLEDAADFDTSPKKKKKHITSVFELSERAVCKENGSDNEIDEKHRVVETTTQNKGNISKTKKKKQNIVLEKSEGLDSTDNRPEYNQNSPKKNKRKRNELQHQSQKAEDTEDTNKPENEKKSRDISSKMEKKKKNAKKRNEMSNNNIDNSSSNELQPNMDNETIKFRKKNKKSKSNQIAISTIQPSDDEEDPSTTETPNPNAITEKDSDSEHDSDDEIQSENEEHNDGLLNTAQEESNSSDEEEDKKKNPEKGIKVKLQEREQQEHMPDPDEIKKTIFVGNVPFSNKCKKDIKKIFNKYGQIDTIRIRTVPVKDGRVTPKLAVIKNELHPDRTTVNVYVKFTDVSSIDKALAANNTVYNNCHLRVTRSDHTGAEHDPRLAVYVGNIPFALEDEGLRAKFEKCGEIESVRIVRDKKTNAGKGFGYVNFVSKDGVELALALPEEDRTIKNRILRVSRCQMNPNKKQNRQHNQGRVTSGPPSRQGFNRGPHDGSRPSNRQGFQNRGPSNRQGFENRGPPSNRGPPGNRGPPNRDAPRKKTWEVNKSGNGDEPQGAFRRLQHKRKFQEGGDGSPNKNQNLNQPQIEKRQRKEFVGMTAEKKKEGGDGSPNKNQNLNQPQKEKRQRKEFVGMTAEKKKEGGDGSPNKNQNLNQPQKEKKQRKEFVGMTAEKKKKQKVGKGEKKKKILSEILTKASADK